VNVSVSDIAETSGRKGHNLGRRGEGVLSVVMLASVVLDTCFRWRKGGTGGRGDGISTIRFRQNLPGTWGTPKGKGKSFTKIGVRLISIKKEHRRLER